MYSWVCTIYMLIYFLTDYIIFAMDSQFIRFVVLPKEFSFYSNLDKDQIEKYKYPTRLNAGLFMIILKGKCELSINLESYIITEESIVTVMPNSIIQMNNYSEEFDAYYLVMVPGYMNDIVLIQSIMPHLSTIMENPVLNIESKKDRDLFLDYCKIFQRIYERQQANPATEIIQSLMSTLIYGLLKTWEVRKNNTPDDYIGKLSRKEAIYHQFMLCLLKHYREERAVSFYANKLCISAKYLSAVIKDIRARSVLALINEAVILDAKAQLKNSNLTIMQISDSLNFANSSFFTKYFKRHTGMTPKEYRIS